MRVSWGLIAVLPLAAAMPGCTPPATQELALTDMVPRSDAAPSDAPAFTVYFEVGSSALTAEAIAVLERLATDPARGQWTKLTLAGHADRSGSVRLNRRVSAARVEAVRQHLLKAGILPELIVTEAFGKRQAKPGTEAEDRRVEIFVTL